jgi:hypothetical protein
MIALMRYPQFIILSFIKAGRSHRHTRMILQKRSVPPRSRWNQAFCLPLMILRTCSMHYMLHYLLDQWKFNGPQCRFAVTFSMSFPKKKPGGDSPSFHLFPYSPAEWVDGLGHRISLPIDSEFTLENGSPAYFNPAIFILDKKLLICQ